MSGSHEVSRRDFVKVVTVSLGTVMGAAIGIPAVFYVITPAVKVQEADAWIPMGPVEGFAAGEPTLVNFTRTKINGWETTSNSYGVYVLRKEGDQFQTLSNTCTHLSCRVSWKTEQQLYTCPCHDAAFNPDGSVVSGPPPRPLDAYENKVEEGTLYIHYVEG